MKKTLLLSSLALAIGAISLPAAADFSGHYDPSNWTTTLTGDPAGGGGSVNTAGAPGSVTLIGGDGGCNVGPCTTQYTNTLNKEFLQFDWSYTTQDIDGPGFDVFGYLVNGVFTQLSDSTDGANQSGTVMLTGLTQGDIFGWEINCADCIFGGATATISNFSVPEPSALALLGLGLLGFGVRRKLAA